MIDKLLRDNFFNGVMLGFLSITLNYILLSSAVKAINSSILRTALDPPKLQLIILAMNIILFRFLMVNWKRVKTGSGLLVAIFASTMWYIYNNKSLIFPG